MPSTYTTNNGIELIATGEQSGTWGSTTNTNLELLDASLDGQVTVTLASAGTSGSPNTLPISDGSASNGRNRLVIFNDGTDLGGTAYVQLTPNDAEKIVYVRNSLSGSRSILLFQGTYNASNDYEVPAGTTAVVFFDGAGTGAVAANVFNNAHFDALNIVGNASVGGTLSVTSTSTFNDDVTFVGNTNNIVIDKSADSMTFQDASRLIFGTGSDLLIEHSGASTESRIWNYGGNLSIAQQANDEDVDILSDNGSGGTASYFRADGSTGEAMLFHYGSEKLATKSTGIDVTGTVTDDGATHDGDVTFTGANYNVVWDKSDDALEFADNAKAIFGAGSDLQIWHSGTSSFIKDAGTGNLNIQAENLVMENTSGTDYITGISGGAVTLFNNGSAKLATTTTGIDVTGTAEVDGLSINGTALTATAAELNYNDITTLGQVEASKVVTADANGDVTFSDNDKVVFGTGSDYEIYNDGSSNEQLVFNEAASGLPYYVFQGNFGGSIGPTLRLKHNVTSGSASSFPATFKMSTKDAGGTDIDTFSITNLLGSATAGASTSLVIFGVQESGGAAASTAYLTLDGSNENITFSKDVSSAFDITAANFNTTSDASLKTNISTFANPLDTINSLRGVAFDWINSGKSEIGVIAQEVEKVLPDLVSTNKEGIKSVKYGNLIAVLIEAVKDQQSQINELKSKLS